MKDVIATDFDHILINEDEEIPVSTIVLFDELRREKKKLIILTDSSLNRILYYNYSFPFIDYIISASGAYVYDVVKEKIIYKKSVLDSNVNKIVKTFIDKCQIYLIDDNNYNLINGYSEDEDITIIEDYQQYLNDKKNKIYKIDLVPDGISINECIEELNKLNLKVNIIRNDNEISIVHEDVKKLDSLKYVVSKCHKEIDDVIYIGVDKTILENVKVSVTTKKENSSLRKISTDITEDCNHKGVEKFLKKYYEKEN